MTLVVGYVGMTHLGLNSAAAAGARGCNVICFDPDQKLIEQLRVGSLPVIEPDLPETLAKNADRIAYTSTVTALAECDVVYVAPDVATDDQGGSDLSTLISLLELVDPHLSESCVQVILSQVPPGFTRPRLRAGRILHYQVETLIFGRAIERAMYPERFIVGCEGPSVPLPPKFTEFLGLFECPILPMRFESAELAKIAINCFLVAQVGTTNTLAEICEAVGADWSEIAPSLRLDARIGPKAYLKPGLGIAGGNLERDLATIVSIGETHKTDTGIIEAEIANSGHRKLTVARFLRDDVLPNLSDPKIAVWGLAYKEDTHSIKNSPSLATLSEFPELSFRVHDPAVHVETTGMGNLKSSETPLEAATDADVLLILTPWNIYREQNIDEIGAVMSGRILIDPNAVIDGAAARAAGFEYITLGAPTK